MKAWFVFVTLMAFVVYMYSLYSRDGKPFDKFRTASISPFNGNPNWYIWLLDVLIIGGILNLILWKLLDLTGLF